MSQDQLRAENDQLKQALTQQQQTVAQLGAILHQRAEPMFLAVMDALDTLSQMAEAGHPQASELLARWAKVQQRARDATSRLAIIRNGHP